MPQQPEQPTTIKKTYKNNCWEQKDFHWIKNLSKPFCWTYIKNQIATERFNSTVSDIEIIKNFLPTPD